MGKAWLADIKAYGDNHSSKLTMVSHIKQSGNNGFKTSFFLSLIRNPALIKKNERIDKDIQK